MPFDLLLVAMAQQGAAETALTRYRNATRAEYRCERSEAENEVTVCALRDADRFRVPILEPTPGDPKIVDAIAERGRLIDYPEQACGLTAFLHDCGMVGVTITVSSRGVGASKPRPLAP